MAARELLRSNKTDIQLILTGNRQLVLDKCFENKLVTRLDYVNLKAIHKGTEGDHATNLVDNIMGKGDKRCQEFVDLLQSDQDIKDAFPDLEQILANPSARLPKTVQESTSAARTADVGQGNRPSPEKTDDEPYPLKSKPTGLCFIINNMEFNDGNPRLGSDKDAVALAKVFSWLGFRVLMCEDQTTDQMDQVLKCLASASDIINLSRFKVKEWSGREYTGLQEVPAHGDAFICCILSHGNMGVVCGTDKKRLEIKAIKKMFLGNDQSPLKHKPKVFLIQACQGEELQGRAVLPDLQSDASRPDECDMLVGIATVEDYESFRHPELGSWYIQSVCKQLWRGCPSGVDMISILTRVNDEVSLKDGKMKERPGVTLKQVPEIRTCLTKKLVFSPPSN